MGVIRKHKTVKTYKREKFQKSKVKEMKQRLFFCTFERFTFNYDFTAVASSAILINFTSETGFSMHPKAPALRIASSF